MIAEALGLLVVSWIGLPLEVGFSMPMLLRRQEPVKK